MGIQFDEDLSEMITRFVYIKRAIRTVQDVAMENMPLFKKDNGPVSMDRETFETVMMAAIIGLQIIFRAIDAAQSNGTFLPAAEGMSTKDCNDIEEKIIKRIMKESHCNRAEALAYMEKVTGRPNPFN